MQQVQLRTYTPEQVAEIYQVSNNTVYKMIKEGRLKAKRINDRVFRIPQSELAWVEKGLDPDILEKEKIDEDVLDSGARDVLKQIRKENFYKSSK